LEPKKKKVKFFIHIISDLVTDEGQKINPYKKKKKNENKLFVWKKE
jgi:hypothetical protein